MYIYIYTRVHIHKNYIDIDIHIHIWVHSCIAIRRDDAQTGTISMSNLFVYACIHLIVHMYINAHTYNKIQHNTIQHNTTQYNTTQYNTTQHNTTQHSTIQHNTTQCNTTQHNTIQHNTDGNMIADVKFFEGNGITKQQRRVRHEPIKFRIAYPPGGFSSA